MNGLLNSHDVLVVVAPTAFGKSAVIRTLQQWLYSVSAITPSNMLVDQFLSEFPDTPSLHRIDSYECETYQTSCARTRALKKGFCKGCACSADLARAKYRRGPGIYNYHTYLAHGLQREVLVVDEAHNLQSILRERLAHRIWIHDYAPLYGALSVASLKSRIDKLTPRQRKHKKIELLIESLESVSPQYVIEFTQEEFNGKGTTRGQPEMRRCIKLLPVDIRDAIQIFLGQDTKKLILLSATIGAVDIRELGLQTKRVAYLQAAHPIDASRRPVVCLDTVNLNRENLVSSLPSIVRELTNLAAYHSGEKGLIHVTYQLSALLEQELSGSRWMFHTRENKAEVYGRFRDSDPREGRVLVACGMYEGIDLPEDAGRWQVIAKTPFKSLGDPAIAHKAKEDPDWYAWGALRDLIQACGRICRTEQDWGTTYLLDVASTNLIDSKPHLVPQWFRDALAEGVKQSQAGV